MHHKQDFEDYLDEPVNIVKLIDKVALDEATIDHCAMEQPSLYLEAARYRVQKMKDKAVAELHEDMVKARYNIKFRRQKKGYFAEQSIKDKTVLQKNVRIARRKKEQAGRIEKFAEMLMRAYEERLQIIRIIIDARFAEVGSGYKKEKIKQAKEISRRLQREVKARYQSGDVEED